MTPGTDASAVGIWFNPEISSFAGDTGSCKIASGMADSLKLSSADPESETASLLIVKARGECKMLIGSPPAFDTSDPLRWANFFSSIYSSCNTLINEFEGKAVNACLMMRSLFAVAKETRIFPFWYVKSIRGLQSRRGWR
jgi:hypothetical protein